MPIFGEFLVVADPLRPADAIIPLAGARSRIDFAVGLFQRGYGRTLLLTDMWISADSPPFYYARSVTEQAIELGMQDHNILIVPGPVATTYEEAVAIREFAEDQQWSSVLVVTGPSHTLRSRIIFRDVFRHTTISIVVRPVENDLYRPRSWWRTYQGRHETSLEYLKLGLYMIGYR